MKTGEIGDPACHRRCVARKANDYFCRRAAAGVGLSVGGGHGQHHVVTSQNNALAMSVQQRAAAADLAAGVSHEVRMRSARFSVGRKYRCSDRTRHRRRALKLIEKGAQMARDATQDLLRMVRQNDQEEARTDLARHRRRRSVAAPRSAIEFVGIDHSATTGRIVRATRSRLFSIVWNLTRANAVQLVSEHGHVRIGCRPVVGGVQLEVADNGPGMTPETQKKIFEPYFTQRDGGTGLGLAIVRGTVEKLGGQIHLDTSPGDGARFQIVLPAVVQTAELTESVSKRISKVMNAVNVDGLTVLIIEDDEGVRELISTTLSLCGVSSVAVGSCKQARELTGSFAVTVVDLTFLTAEAMDCSPICARQASHHELF
ncbi:MAG: hybrid sensor histidine kinase/response regulator [Polyangiales bacterium]